VTQEEINKQSALLEAINRDLERAGVTGVNRGNLIKALLDPGTMTQDENDFLRLQQLGDPDYRAGAEPGEELFGQDAAGLDAKMKEEFLGRGWSPDDLKTLPKHPMDGYVKGGIKVVPQGRQLSPGGRQADEYRRRRELIQGVTSPSLSQKIGRFIPDALLSTEESAPTSLDRNFDDPVKAFEAQRNRKKGTSGNVAAMENPEYNFAWYSNNFAQPFTDTIQYSMHEGEQPQFAMERANERRQALAAGKAVDPILPNFGGKYDRERKESLFSALRSAPDHMRPMTYDMSFRNEYGYYPSYFDSHATEFAQNLPDFPTLVSAAMGIPLGWKALAGFATRESAEEIPTYAAIVGGQQAIAGDAANPIPRLTDWQASDYVPNAKYKFGENSPEFAAAKEAANKARTDLYTRDSYEAPPRPETEEEFKQSVEDKRKSQSNAEAAWSKMKSALQGK
jgi:hypothetical protein